MFLLHKRSLRLLLCFFCFATQSVQIFSEQSLECSKQLKPILALIQKLPEARALITKVQKEGNVRIALNTEHTKKFAAFWDSRQRAILVNYTTKRSEGQLMCSIIFELHNALANSKLDQLNRLVISGKIGKSAYVEAIEQLEYGNCLHTAAMLRKGVQQKIFPATAKLNVSKDFNAHYRLQKAQGHSAWIAQNYDLLASKKRDR